MATLQIINLHAKVEDKEILKGVNLTIKENETLALLGPNGHGKSTLLSVIMGHPKYEVTEGQILLDGQDVLSMSVDERSRAGLFLAMQYPSEVPGVINSDFLKAAMNARREKPLSLFQFYKALDKASSEVKFSMDMVNRSLNEGFSGGEKKRNEIFQMMLLNPAISMLDEIDSGLDVDAISIVSDAINKIKKETNMGFLVVSHYARLYDLIHPTRAAVMINGQIVVEGGPEIIKKIDTTGYEWIRTEFGIKIEKDTQDMNTISIGSCATKEVLKHE
ncbi:MAG: Fe-S cluster assembly ATPase SufC [Bacilli bacterium]|nr:Fe-S cluster assembly ATPase SufC [Bacilli bacterium]